MGTLVGVDALVQFVAPKQLPGVFPAWRQERFSGEITWSQWS